MLLYRKPGKVDFLRIIFRFGLPLCFNKFAWFTIFLGTELVQQKRAHRCYLKNRSMAHPNLALIGTLRQAAENLRNGAAYAWGHHGSCNCGHVLQVITHLGREEILRYAHTGIGEWTEIADEYCGVTQVPAYLMVSKLEAIGLTPTDIHCLEYLKDREVLERIPGGFRWLQKNNREDVILYFETMASMLEENLLQTIEIPKPGNLIPANSIEV